MYNYTRLFVFELFDADKSGTLWKSKILFGCLLVVNTANIIKTSPNEKGGFRCTVILAT